MIMYVVFGCLIVLFFLFGIRIIRPTERGLVERFGKYNRYANPGLNWTIPLVESVLKVNVTETLVEAKPQQIITKDKLNARVDAQVYYKVLDTEEGVKNSQYNVANYELQITNLARTTLRNIIGTLTLNEANSQRDTINNQLLDVLKRETKTWGIDVVRTELKEIDPPEDVQETMNKVVKAENEKQAAVDFATAAETRADGERRSNIKIAEGAKQSNILKAEGERQSAILRAQGQAEAFNLINKSFTGNAQLLRKLEVTESSLRDNAKIILPEGKSLVNVIGSLSGENRA